MRATSPVTNLRIETQNLHKAVLVFRAVNNRLRQQMLRLIHKNGRMTVTNIYQKLNLMQSKTSNHLAILRKAGLVTTLRKGNFIYYAVNHKHLAHLHTLAAGLLG